MSVTEETFAFIPRFFGVWAYFGGRLGRDLALRWELIRGAEFALCWKAESWRCFKRPLCGTDYANGADACASPPPCECGFAAHRRLRTVSGILPSAIFFGASCPGAPARRRNGPIVTVGKRLRVRTLGSLVELVHYTSLPVAARLRCGRWAGYAGPRLTGSARRLVIQTRYDRSALLRFKLCFSWSASMPDASDAIQAPRPSRRRPSMDRRALRS